MISGRWKVAGAAALAAVVVGACGGASTGGGNRASQQIVIGWTPPDITGVFKTATDYFEKAAADANSHGFNIKVLSRSPATHTSFADQAAIVENYVTQHVDVIVISPADTEALKPAMRSANKAKIPVVMVNLLEPQKDVEIASYVGFDNGVAAEVSAYSVVDYFGPHKVLGTSTKPNISGDTHLDLKWWEDQLKGTDPNSVKATGAIIQGIGGTFFSQARLDGFHKIIDKYPGIKIVGEPLPADWNRQKAITATENILSRYKSGELNFIWAASNEMGMGAMLTLDRHGMLAATGSSPYPGGGKVAVFTNDSTPESTDFIRQGKIVAETTHGFPDWGWYGTKFAVMLACHESAPKTFDIDPRTVWQGNADKFYPTPALPAINWDDIKSSCK